MKLEPVPLAGDPPVAVHANVYGVLPPDAVAVNVTGDPTIPVAGPEIVVASGSGAMTIVADAVAVLLLESVAVTVTVNVPLILYVVVKLDPVPVAGLPPGALQLNVYGDVPPDAEAVKVTAVPTIPLVGPLTVAASASGLIAIVADAVAVLPLPSVAVTVTV